MAKQNIFDNETFFSEYQKLREREFQHAIRTTVTDGPAMKTA